MAADRRLHDRHGTSSFPAADAPVHGLRRVRGSRSTHARCQRSSSTWPRHLGRRRWTTPRVCRILMQLSLTNPKWTWALLDQPTDEQSGEIATWRITRTTTRLTRA